MKLPTNIDITEVGPRDGFQIIQEWIPTETKLRIIEELIGCGFKKIEVTSFVNPKAVPQMADAQEILTTIKHKYPDICLVALAPNLKGVTRALEGGADIITYIVSASEDHNYNNTKQTIDQSLEGLKEVCKVKGNTKVYLGIPTVFNCPWSGQVPYENIARIIDYGFSVGADEVGCADTVGSANPSQVKALVEYLGGHFPDSNIVWHLHDTYGMGLANALTAMQSGATRFETSVGGLGGCPFAPGAAGNLASEDLVNMLEGMGIQTGIDLQKLIKVVSLVEQLLPVPINSHVARAQSCKVHP